MSLPAISMGLTADDFDLAHAVTRDPLSAYAFKSRDPLVRHAKLLEQRTAGTIAWWSDLDMHQAFFRPLSSLSLALDFKLWPGAPWLMHLENSLLFALIVLVASSLYQALGLSPGVRGLATLFFAMQSAQSMTIGWISGRNTLLATLFGFLAFRMFVAARSGGGWFRLALSLLCFVAALLSAEVGVSAVAYVFAYAVWSGTQPPRLRALAGFALAIVAWLAFYKAHGYGVRNSPFYVDVTHDPGRFALDLAYAIPIYLASQLTVPFASWAAVARQAAPALAVISLIVLYASRRLWLPWVTTDSRARVLGLGSVLAIVPLGSSPPQDRMVSFVALGVCGVIALIVDERLGSQRLEQKGALRLLRFHAIWAPLLFIPFLFGTNTMVAGAGGVLLDQTLGDDPRPVVLVNPPAFLPVHFFAQKREWFGQPHPSVDVLYAGSAKIELTRIGEHTLQLTAARGALESRVDDLQRAPGSEPLHVGEVVPGVRMRTQVLELTRGAPTRVRFDFLEPLSNVRLYTWQGRSLQLLKLPELSESVHIEPASPI